MFKLLALFIRSVVHSTSIAPSLLKITSSHTHITIWNAIVQKKCKLFKFDSRNTIFQLQTGTIWIWFFFVIRTRQYHKIGTYTHTQQKLCGTLSFSITSPEYKHFKKCNWKIVLSYIKSIKFHLILSKRSLVRTSNCKFNQHIWMDTWMHITLEKHYAISVDGFRSKNKLFAHFFTSTWLSLLCVCLYMSVSEQWTQNETDTFKSWMKVLNWNREISNFLSHSFIRNIFAVSLNNCLVVFRVPSVTRHRHWLFQQKVSFENCLP